MSNTITSSNDHCMKVGDIVSMDVDRETMIEKVLAFLYWCVFFWRIERPFQDYIRKKRVYSTVTEVPNETTITVVR